MDHLDKSTSESIRLSFGPYGLRALEYLESAQALLEGELRYPRWAESVAYAIREALDSLLNSQRSAARTGEWADVSRAVVRASASLEEAKGLSAHEQEAAFDDLLESIAELDQFHEKEGRNERRLVAVLATRTGSAPFDPARDSIESYLRILREVSKILHSSGTAEALEKLWVETVATLQSLFTPVEVRSERLERLALVQNPTTDDVSELRRLIVAPNYFRKFIQLLPSVAWLQPLSEAGLLALPNVEAWWPGFDIVTTLGAAHPDDVIRVFAVLWKKSDKGPRQAFTIARAVMGMGTPAADLLIRVLRAFPAQLVDIAVSAAESFPPEHAFVADVAETAFDPIAYAAATYLDPLIQAFVDGTAEENYESRLRMLQKSLSTVADRDQWGIFIHDYSRPIAGRPEDYEGLAVQLTYLMTQIIQRVHKYSSRPFLLDLIANLPTEVRGRMLSWFLSNEDQLVVSEARALIVESVGTRWPTTEDLVLTDRVGSDRNLEDYASSLAAAYGPPPSIEELGNALGSNDVPEAWRYKFLWSALVPRAAVAAWQSALDIMSGRFGSPSREGLERHDRPEFEPISSPIPASELIGQTVEQAIQTIVSWRQGPEHGSSSAIELAAELPEVFRSNRSGWFSNPLATVSALRHPTYISSYIRSLQAEFAENKTGLDQIVDVAQLIFAEPWIAPPIGDVARFDYEENWQSAQSAMIDFFRKLANEDVGYGDRSDDVWRILRTAALKSNQPGGIREDGDPLTRAINYPPTRAFQVSLAFMGFEFRAKATVRQDALLLLDQVLEIEEPAAVEFRAIIATELPLLNWLAHDWLDAHFDAIFGKTEPEELGRTASDAAIKWGRTSEVMLTRATSRVHDAVTRNVEHALDRVLIGMLWGTKGYSPREVAVFLGREGKLSEAAQILGRLLRPESQLEVDQIGLAIEFWRESLAAKPSQMLSGFGWLARSTPIPDDIWLELTRSTLERRPEPLAVVNMIAERVATLAPTEETLELLNTLVERQTHAWDLGLVFKHAEFVLERADDLKSTDEYLRLRQSLRERGFAN